MEIAEIRNRPGWDSPKACVGVIFWTGLETSLADAAGRHADDAHQRKGRTLNDLMASAEIPVKAQRTMPHGAELHDGGSTGFTQFPERFRTSIRHSLGFGIVTKRMPADSSLNLGS